MSRKLEFNYLEVCYMRQFLFENLKLGFIVLNSVQPAVSLFDLKSF